MDRSTLVRRVAPFAVFAAVLGGVAVAGSQFGNDARTPRDLDPIPLGARSGTAGTEQTAGAPRDSAGAGASDMYWRGEIVIPDDLLRDLPTEGPVHQLSPSDPTTERILALARALGLVGVVQRDAEGWYVDGVDDHQLRVYRQPGTPWHYGIGKTTVVGVATAEPDRPEDGDTPVAQDDPCTEKCETPPAPPKCEPPKDGTEPACLPADCPEKSSCEPVEPTKPPQPSDEEARATAQRVFDAVGLTDPAITLNDAWSGKEVVAAPVVGGLPTANFETRVTVELGGKVQYANGHLGTTALKGDYPLLAPREAVDRDGPYGAPRAQVDYAPCEAPPCPSPEPREVKGLRLGLVFMTSYDAEEGAFLAPAWLLTFAEGTWAEPVLALPDRYLAAPPAASDAPAPMPPDSGTSSGGGTDGSTGSGGTSTK